MLRRLLGIGFCVSFFASSSLAVAAECTPPGDNGPITVDGYLTDWQGISSKKLKQSQIKCLEADHLFLAFVISDPKLSSKKGPPTGMVVSVGTSSASAVTFFVRPGTEKHEPIYQAPDGIELSDSQVEGGWVLEAKIPWSLIPGWSAASPAVSVRASSSENFKRGVALGPAIKFKLRGTDDLLKSYLKDIGENKSSIIFDDVADINFAPGKERIVVVGKNLAILSSGYSYLTLPVADKRDIKKVAFIAPSKNGARLVATEYEIRNRSKGAPAMRKILALWRQNGSGQLERVLALETGRARGSKKWKGSWKMVTNRKLSKDPNWQTVSDSKRGAKGEQSIVLTGPAETPPAFLPFEDVFPLSQEVVPGTAFVFEEGVFKGTLNLEEPPR